MVHSLYLLELENSQMPLMFNAEVLNSWFYCCCSLCSVSSILRLPRKLTIVRKKASRAVNSTIVTLSVFNWSYLRVYSHITMRLLADVCFGTETG